MTINRIVWKAITITWYPKSVMYRTSPAMVEHYLVETSVHKYPDYF